MAFSKPSAHRCMILKLSRLLSREDVNELLFLSEDFIPQSEVEQIFSGVDLMRSLEQHGRLSPAKYDYLLACLKEVGRLDLVIKNPQNLFLGIFWNSYLVVLEVRTKYMPWKYTSSKLSREDAWKACKVSRLQQAVWTSGKNGATVYYRA